MKCLRILVVEDNAPSLRLVEDLLAARGHHVTSAVNVGQARALLAERELPDIILLDVQVPGGGGTLVLREVRENRALDGVPVIAVTALAMAGDKEKFLALGFSGYISKPITARTFGEQVEDFVHGAAAPVAGGG